MRGDVEAAVAGRTAIPVQPYLNNRCWPHHLAAGPASAAPRDNTRWPSDPHLAQPAAALPSCAVAKCICQSSVLCGLPSAQAGPLMFSSLADLGSMSLSIVWALICPFHSTRLLYETAAAAGPGSNSAVANSAAFSAMQNSNMPTITSVVFDGFLSDCTVSGGDMPCKYCRMHQIWYDERL